MDRTTVIGFILIAAVLVIWMVMNAPPPATNLPGPDTSAAVKRAPVPDTAAAAAAARRRPERTPAAGDSLGKFFSHLSKGTVKAITVETGLYRATISTRGASVTSWILRQYKTWNQYPADLINNTAGRGDFHLEFFTSDGKLVNTRDLVFDVNVADGSVITLGDGDSMKIDFVLDVAGRSRIVKSLTFHGGLYSFDASYRFEEMQSIISNFEYQVTWDSGIRYQEGNSINESNFAKASVMAGGEITDVDATKFNEPVTQSISGRVTWIAARNKYFAVAIIPTEKESEGATLVGDRVKLPDEGAREDYSLALKMPFRGSDLETDRFTVFLGPLNFDVVRHYNVELEKVMSLGAAWLIRPISEYVIIPVFKFLRYFIPNYGVVLIVFSLLIKIALYPLTKTSMRSMQRMQALQPMMEEIRQKYKDDPQKMNQQVMRLYKEYGVNPAGGCLPMLLQLPILYALWAVFSSAIELRQASFVWWIYDLSSPDVIARLPFRLPFFNIDEISGLALLMGVTTFVQQKMSTKDPRQKMMVWMMPVLLTLMFNGFPSGLNLYYFVFNLFSIAQQAWINKQHKNEPLRKVEEKKKRGGLLTKMTKDLPRLKT